MSGWISSKLKVAETLLQQIDQQAAESLRKNEGSRSDDDLSVATPKKAGDILPPLKEQLKKKKAEKSAFVGRSRNDSNLKEVGGSANVNPKSSLTDSDWTELLSAPSKSINGGVPRVSGLLKEGKRQVRSGSNLLGLEKKRNQAVSARKSDVVNSDRIDANQRQTSVGVQGVAENPSNASVVVDQVTNADVTRNKELNDENTTETETLPVPDMKLHVKDEPISGVPTTSSSSKTDSVSDSDSVSSSESESEGEREERRKRREQLLAEKAAAKVIEAIKDRENLVARLEGEKQSLEKMMDQRAKQQAHEASELQMTMMETMEAVDLEKQKHNNTRMEALMKLAKLETTNAELAKSLATAQWNLEVEVKRVAQLHRQIELKEATHEELTSKKKSHHSGNKLMTSTKGVEFEHEILEAEHVFITDKVGQLQDKMKTLERSIEVTRKEIENPTEVEVELKRRLSQLTDHLIHKQAQVESLSSEKAMLMFRIEAVSRSLEENKSCMKVVDNNDIESGNGMMIWEVSNSRLKERLRNIGSLVRQLDSIFFTGATFLRRNPTARIWSFVYLVCLHVWVLYIFRSHSLVDDAQSGALISLENINTTRV